MRSLSGARNRTTLAVAGLLILALAAWGLVVSYGLAGPGGLVAAADSTVSDVVQAHRGWLLPAAIAASVVALLAGLALLLAQIPTAPTHSRLRLHHGDGTVLAGLEPQVLERALVERVEGVPGIEDASMRVTGSASELEVLGEVAVSDRAEVGWAVAQARSILAADLETALGVAPRAVDVIVRLNNPRSAARADRVSVRHQDGGTRTAEPS